MSAHADAVRVLGDWRAPTVAQDSLRQRYLAHLATHPDGLWRRCRPDHLTASTIVLDESRSRVLLTLHAKAQRWFQFGGHIEDDASLLDAATREAREESGIPGLLLDPTPVQLSEHEVPFCRRPDVDGTAPAGSGADAGEQIVHHLDVRFLAVAPRDAVHAVSEESLDVRWWPIDALPRPDADMVELVTLALARQDS
ncbi:NUDIX hydrolase [Nocardioides sp. R-C-SC26]|uniref:NUDIX hydrolase n=1 Tax=Nocardioides sp. R-C-SC26 TaxID=2870414 RepID=UPI001E3E0632|nr:NUDIX hydrolase [Nocardioides sp. R-C-SC26]